ncbi:MAG: aminotransferase class I/II-fold pyridoxal phosphate-dependent enzyme, partial [Endomicrobiia bacterium]|nr:aminotransferase class I/II-fold pyridoxal phosphate-dependent enzyme [Endomicrobiia bacterium]
GGTARGRLVLDGREVVNFASNDYLGLSTSPAVVEAAGAAAVKYGGGGASSRLMSGNSEIHEELEARLAAFKRSETAMVFPSGYQTNLSVISSLVGDGDCVLLDRLNHASLVDGARLSGARIGVYRHAAPDDLARALKITSRYRRRLVVTDALFSMDGDLAELGEIAGLAEKHGAILMIDEAHSTGIFGARSSGAAEHFGVEDRIAVKMGTLSKAIGSQGGFVCVSSAMKDYFINKSRGFIYTTALAPSSCGAAIAAIAAIAANPSVGAALLERAAKLRSAIRKIGFDTGRSFSQIIPILVGESRAATTLSDRLFEKGFYAPAVRYPTVSKKSARLRVSLTAAHTDDDIEAFLSALKSCS